MFARLICAATLAALTRAAPIANDTRAALDARGWFDVGYGLMLEPRDWSDSFPTPSLTRRAHPATRDLVGRELHEVALDDGGLFFPQNALATATSEPARARLTRRLTGAVSATLKVIVTYYTGHDLLNRASPFGLTGLTCSLLRHALGLAADGQLAHRCRHDQVGQQARVRRLP